MDRTRLDRKKSTHAHNCADFEIQNGSEELFIAVYNYACKFKLQQIEFFTY